MSKRPMYVTVVIGTLLLGGVTWASHDITQPGDVIQGIPNDGVSQNQDHGWPGNEAPNQAIDNQITTKYLHFKGEDEPTGIRVTPKAGPSVITGIRLCTANDAVERDPVKWELSGSNESIDGPYTLIAQGDIVDFVGGVWPRRTWNTTPITFTNTVSYEHYQLMFPLVSNPASANSMQIAEIELVAQDLTASAPNPPDNKLGVTLPLLQWTPGDLAQLEDVYVGTTPDLTEADRTSSRQPATLKMHYYTAGLVPGQTYYWRVDDIDAEGNVYTGTVWKFMASPLMAFSPVPRDGNKWLSVTTTLSWLPGQNGIKHDVYFGTDKAQVEARDASVAKGTTSTLDFDPGPLAQNTTYYWAVDETTISGEKVPGTVWSFTTIGGGGGILGEYFVGSSPAGTPSLTRIDQGIDINTDASPGAPVPADGWSAAWTADLEIAVTDTYTFSLNCQDGTRMWIDGQLIIDKWVIPTVTSEYFALPLELEPGIHALRVEYFDSGGTAVEQLYWSTSTMAKVIVPAGPLQPPAHAQSVYPLQQGVDVPQNVALTWLAGYKAQEHDVYFGTDAAAVANATPDSADIYVGRQPLDEVTYRPGLLEWNQTYYWRIDEVNDVEAGSPWTGMVWSFTTADFIVVDNMEGYTDVAGNEIFTTWVDGLTDGLSNSTVGYLTAPFAEQATVHGGKQSMPMEYDNARAPFFSEAQREFAPVQDWTTNGVNTLVVYVAGLLTNGAGQVYVAVEDSAGKSAVVANADDTLVTKTTFTEWKIPLSEFTGVDVTQVKKLYIGVGDRKNPTAGGAGRIFIDDVGVIQE
jgi:hypothetical protein